MSRRPGRPAEAPTLSGKTARLMKLFEEDLKVRYADLTARDYLGHVRAWLAFLAEQGGSLTDVRTDDLIAYQSALYSFKKPDDKPYQPVVKVRNGPTLDGR